MASPLASAAVERGGVVTDVAVPLGTTVAGLLAMMRIDTSAGDVSVTTTDGRRADPAAVIGLDMPSGVMLSVSGRRATDRARRDAAQAGEDAWFPAALARSTAFLLVAAVEAGALIAPLAGSSPLLGPGVPAAARPLLALVCSAVLAAAAARRGTVTAPAGALLWTAAAGALPLALLDPGAPLSAIIAPPLACWTAFVAALALWLATRHPVPAAAAGVWGAVGAVVSLMAAQDVRVAAVAPVALALAVLICAIVPDASMRLPDSQLLDLPAVTTAAPAVRSPEVSAPRRITGGRVSSSLARAEGVSETLVLACSALAAACAWPTTRLASLEDWQGGAALALTVGAALGLGLLPRSSRSRAMRLWPRAAAAATAAALATSPAVLADLGAVGAAGLLVVAAACGVLAAVRFSREPRPVLLARAADIAQSLTLLAVLPLAVAAAGLFDLVRQVAS